MTYEANGHGSGHSGGGDNSGSSVADVSIDGGNVDVAGGSTRENISNTRDNISNGRENNSSGRLAGMLTDAVWDRVKPLLPAPKARRHRYPGRKPLPDREALVGILYILETGTPWEHLPLELGCGSGMTCWRRLRDWRRSGAWSPIEAVLSESLPEADKLDFSRANGISTTPGAKRAKRLKTESPEDGALEVRASMETHTAPEVRERSMADAEHQAASPEISDRYPASPDPHDAPGPDSTTQIHPHHQRQPVPHSPAA